MMNKFPCRICHQSQADYNHSVESQILERERRARDYSHRGLFDQYNNEVKLVSRLIYDSFQHGYDGHHYNPVDNLTYLEMKLDNCSSL